MDLYLAGCNTAINPRGSFSVAQHVSEFGPTVRDDNVMLTVYGTVGYLAGNHFEGTETTTARHGVPGSRIDFPPYPDAPDGTVGPRGIGTGVNIGSHDAVGRACWRGYREGRRVV